jgi:PAS domain S-box-containing protein
MTSPNNLAEILGKINDGICIWSADQQVSFVNERASQILKADDELFQRKIETAMKEGSQTRFEYFHAGVNRWFEHHTYPNADGGLTLISRDITSRHRMEEALRVSEERFRRLIESNIIGVIVMEDGCLTEANDVFLKMVDSTRADLVRGQLRWRDMTPHEFNALDTKAAIELESKGVFTPYEKELVRKGGNRLPVLVGGVAIQASESRHETLCLVLDLSERRRIEEGVHSMVECGKILASALECEKTFPELAEFIVSKLADSCLIFAIRDGRLIRLAAAHSTVSVVESELQPALNRVRSSGKEEVISTHVSRALVPIIARNEIAGVLVAATARPNAFDAESIVLFKAMGRRMGTALENARLYHETQRANRLKDEFVAIISHELRTPLTPILGGVYMIRNEPNDNAIVGRALDLIERNVRTQVKIVDDLLDVSRALSGKFRIHMEPVDLPRVIQSAVETVRPASEAKNIRIDVQVSPLEGTVTGDPDRLQQVVWNLLSNSVKFTPNSGHIIVELSEGSGFVEIRVIDDGMGIDPSFLPYVFEKFRQADTSRTRPHGGLGLGLAIVRHLVESHGGTVHADSPGDEQGATFVVRLPLRPAVREAQAR